MRRRKAQEKEILADPKFNSKVVAKFINMVMNEGKKSIAENIVYGALEIAREKTGEPDALKVFNKALENVRPRLEVKPRRVGGATYQVPIEVREERKLALAFRWILNAAKAKKGKPMREKLSDELISASNNEGAAIKKKADIHRMAEANRAFAHFAR